LSDGRAWIAGAQTSVADFAIYHALWFMTARSARLAHELVPCPRVNDWMARMRAFGHGTSSPMTAAEALNIAAATQPATPRASKRFDEDPSLGSHVRIRADDYGRDPVDGELVLIDANEIALHRRGPQLGDIVVHFPRLGYDLRAV
jgi:hypothetical protein